MSRGETAIDLLCEALDKDPDICEVGKSFFQGSIVSAYPDHRLAVDASVVPDLYVHAHRSLFELRSQCHCVTGTDTPPQAVQSFDRLSRVLLLFNSECTTAWNIRKELLEARLTHLSAERHLCDVVLRSFPKSRETFAHRRWLARSAMQSRTDGSIVAGQPSVDFLKQEQRVCQWCAELARQNYQAWNHRLWVMKQLVNCSDDPAIDLLGLDLSDTDVWLESHVSDYSGMHHRYCVLVCVRDSLRGGMHSTRDVSFVDRLTTDLDRLSGLIQSFSGHQSLWYYRRAVAHLLAMHLTSLSSDGNSADSETRVKNMTVMKKEEEFIDSIREQSSEGIEDFGQSELASKHVPG